MTVTSTQFDRLLIVMERLVETTDRIATALEASNDWRIAESRVKPFTTVGQVTMAPPPPPAPPAPARGGTRRL